MEGKADREVPPSRRTIRPSLRSAEALWLKMKFRWKSSATTISIFCCASPISPVRPACPLPSTLSFQRVPSLWIQPPSAFVFPMVGALFFIFLGFVTWSFRDVAYRHSQKFEATRHHETGVDEFGHTKI